MSKFEDIKWSSNPLKRRNRIEEALMPILEKSSQPETPPVPSKPKPRLFKTFLLGLLALLILSLSGYLIYREFISAKVMTPDKVIVEVSKLASLPTDETPVVSTVTDLLPLKGQAFFVDAALGDKVLIFEKAKKAILYRPSADKIIIIAPIK
ncbi:hypothetical protein KW800_02810 [Candidatus Parcubacteria bacterium]|nr:hypothetical protein [Candidatus Parcubacteria bacterium]